MTSKWVIDATGRQRLFNRLLVADNIEKEPEPNTSAFWVRVKGADRSHFLSGIDERTMTAPYYATNHFFGLGYWIWMIPLNSGELSIGIVYDKNVISPKELAGKDLFLNFLSTEHRMIYNLIRSGKIEDCLALGHLPYRAKKSYSAERWGIIGDAGSFEDPFLSPGISNTAIGITQLTELIKMDLANHCSAEQCAKFADDQNFIFDYWHKLSLGTYKKMYRFSDDPRAMQEKIKVMVTFWFHIAVPLFVTRIYLRPFFVSLARKNFFNEINERLDELFMAVRASTYTPKFVKQIYRINEVIKIDYLNDCIYEPCNFNAFPTLAHVYWYSIKLRLRLLWGVYGLGAPFKWKQIKWISIHFFEMLLTHLMGLGASVFCGGQIKNQQLDIQEAKFKQHKELLRNRNAA